MKLKMIVKIALKNLWAHKLRSALTITGVTIGIGAIVFLVSLGYGLEKLVTSQVANFNAFTVIDVPAANLKTIKLDSAASEKIQKFGHIQTIAPVVNLAGRVKKIDSSSSVESVFVGADKDYWKLAEITADSGKLPEDDSQAVVNQSVLNLLSETKESIINQKLSLELIIPQELQKNGASAPKLAENVTVTVVGTIKDEKAPVMLMPLALVQSAGAEHYSSLKLKADSKDSVAGLRQQLENAGFSSEYVGDTVSEISQVFGLFRAVLGAFGLIALVVAALGAFNTLTISLLERVREIGLFKALGMRNRDIYKLFMTESLLIGMMGGLLGLIVGEGLGQVTNVIMTLLSKRVGADAVTVFATPLVFAVAVAFFSLVVGFATGWYPAKRAVKLNPLDALRYE